MKLISLKIRGFKNLDIWETPIDFSHSCGISVFVGSNGSGKSNILEAISAIFYGLYNKTSFDASFEFEIEYETYVEESVLLEDGGELLLEDGTPIVLDGSNKKATFTVKNIEKFLSFNVNNKNISLNHKQIDRYLPKNIFTLYSGEETRLYEKYYLKEYDRFISNIISGKNVLQDQIRMNFIDKSFWSIALLTFAMYEKAFTTSEGKNFDYSDILGIPKVFGAIFKFNDKILKSFKGKIEAEFYDFLDNIKDSSDYGIEHLRKINGISVYEDFYKMLLVATMSQKDSNKIIDSIDVYYEVSKGNLISANTLSEGQKKQILILFVTKVLANKDSIVLLDEPDSHIHIGKKQKIKSLLEDFLKVEEGGQVLLTTHSPTLMNTFDKKHLFYLESGGLSGKEKREILNEITDNCMSYTEQQILLHTTKDILIVEGKTDEVYIQTALQKLKPNNPKYSELEFEFLLMGGSDSDVLTRFSNNFPAKKGQNIIAFFDRDHSGLKCIEKCLGKTNLKKETFQGEKVKDIFISFYPKKSGFSESIFEVEDYFRIETCRDFLFPTLKNFGNLKQGFKKSKFADTCSEFDSSEFEGFKVLFDKILEIQSI